MKKTSFVWKLLFTVAILVLTLTSCGILDRFKQCQHRDENDDSLCDKCGDEYTDGKDVFEHVCTTAEREENRVEADCQKTGSYDLVTYCPDCGKELGRTSVTIEKTTHKDKGWIIDAAASCTAPGTRHKECAYCGITIAEETISALGHAFAITESVDATCADDGLIRFTCQREGCNASKSQISYATGHDFGADNICDNCGYTESYEHTHEYTETLVEPTCTEMGYTLYECSCGYKYRDNYIEQKGHFWNDGTVTTPATCTAQGVLTYVCLECGDAYDTVIAAEHDWQTNINTAPDCTIEGSATKVCSKCGERDDFVLPAEHKWGNAVIIKEGSCTEVGIENCTCEKCGLNQDFETQAKGHVYKNGICTVCGGKFIDGVTPKPNHPEYGMYFEIEDIISRYGPDYINEYGVLLDYNEDAKIEKVAVYLTQDGTMWRRCIAVVGTGIKYANYVPYLSYGEEIKYTGLNSAWINVFPLKENSSGIWCYSNYTTIGVNLKDKNGKLLLSLYDIGQAGSETRVFDNLNEMIAWLLSDCDEHSPSDWITDYEATCSKEGLRHKECTDCGAIIEKESIPKTNHSYSDGICTVCGEKDSSIPNYSVGLEYTSNGDGTCYVSGIGTCTDTHIVIPAISPDGWKVTAIGDNAFNNQSHIVSVILPEGLVKIGWSFRECTNLEYISFPESLSSIVGLAGETCFWNTKVLEADNNLVYVNNWLVNQDSNSYSCNLLVIRDSTVGIANHALMLWCWSTNLTNKGVIIPNSVKYIGDGALIRNDSYDIYYEGTIEQFKQIEITESHNTFHWDNVYYYSETQPTEEGNFWHYVDGVPTVWDAYVAPDVPAYSVGLEYTISKDGNYYILDGIGTCKDTEIIIPPTYNGLPIEVIGERAFENCLDITKVVIPDGVKRIGEIGSGATRSFRGCMNLTEIVIPDSVSYIGAVAGESAFFGCKELWSYENGVYYVNNWALAYQGWCTGTSNTHDTPQSLLEIRDGTIGIGNQAFIHGPYSEAVIPSSVKYVCQVAFLWWNNAERVYYTGTEEQWSKILIDESNDGITDHPVYYYSETQPTTEDNFWHYVDGVPTIWDAHIHNYTTATTAPTCTAQGYTTYTCACGYSYVGDYVPALGHTYTTAITAPTCTAQGYTTYTCACGYSYVGDYTNALGHTEAIDSATDATCTTSGLTEGKHCSACGEILVAQNVIPAGHNYVNNSCSTCGETDPALFNFALIADGTYEISAKSVNQLPANVVLPTMYNGVAVTKIADNGFSLCFNKTTFMIPDGIVSIGKDAFYCSAGVRSLTISKTVTDIHETSFSELAGVESLTVASDNPTYYSVENCLIERSTNTLVLSGKFCIIPDCVTAIGNYSCSRHDYAVNVIIPDSVTSIGEWAFGACLSLKTIVLPESVTAISDYAFSICSQLQIVYYKGTVSDWDRISISTVYNEALLNATRYYYSETAPTTEGNFWHYVDGVPTIWDAYVEPETPAYSQGLEYMLKSDGTYAVTGFGSCNDAQIIIPSTYNSIPVTEIYYNAFSSPVIKNVIFNFFIPDSITIIDIGSATMHPFPCESLIGITVDSNNPCYQSINGNLYSKDGKELLIYANAKSDEHFEILDGITTIHPGAFYAAKALKYIVLPESTTNIARLAFYSCTNISEVFYFGTKSTWDMITIGDLNEEFLKATRYYYSETQPTTEGNFWHYVDGVPTIWDAYVEPEAPTYSQGLAYTSNGDGTCYVSGIGTCTDTDIVIPKVSPEGWIVSKIGNNVFSNQAIVSISLPDTIVEIGYNAFNNCSSLKNIYISNLEAWCNISFLNGFANPLERGGNLWLNNELVTTLVVPASITEIKAFSFEGCRSIQNVAFHDDIIKIGREAFFNCPNIKTITIPDSVTDIDDWAFYWCSGLESVTIGKGVKNIGWEAFYECNSIKTLVFSDGATVIGDRMFGGCSSLTDVIIPNSINLIFANAFHNCSSLKNIYYKGTMEEWTSIVIDNKSIGGDDNILDLTILYYSETAPTTEGNFWHYVDGVPTIWDAYVEPEKPDYSVGLEYTSNGDGTCYVSGIGTCTDTDIVIPSISPDGDSVTRIGSDAFNYCSSLTSVIIPDSITSIGERAFSWCTSLTSIVIPDSVTRIGFNAFYYCSSLTSVIIPDSITSIGECAFASCFTLAIIFVEEENSAYKSIDGNLYSKDGKTLIQYAIGKEETSFTIPDSVTSIGYYAFYNCYSLTSIVIPDSVTNIDEWAFSNCYALTSIVIPDSVTSIGDGVFSGCSTLTSIVILDSVTNIGDYSFFYCTSLTSIVIPDSITSIGDYAFDGCTKLEAVYYVGTSSDWNAIDIDNEYNINSVLLNATRYYYSETAPTTEGNFWHYVDGVPTIWDAHIHNYTTAITAPTCTAQGYTTYTCVCGDTYTGNYVNTLNHSFVDGVCTYCYGYDTVINADKYFQFTLLDNGTYSIHRLWDSSVVFPQTVAIPEEYNNVPITNLGYIPNETRTLIISKNLASVALISLIDVNRITSIIVDEGNEVFHSKDNCFIETDTNTLILGCENSIIPDYIQYIRRCAFYNCVNLKNVSFSEGLLSIEDWAFYGTTSLESIYIPSTVEYIDRYAYHFVGDSVNSITVHEDNLYYHSDGNCLIETATNSVFVGCKNSTIPNYIEKIYCYAFDCCSEIESIVIPKSVTFIDGWTFSGCHNIIIYCEATSKPEGFCEYWHGGYPVVWDCNNNDVAEDGYIYVKIDGIGYALKDNQAKVVGCLGEIIEVNIVSEVTYNGVIHSVTSIEDYAFNSCTNLISITISDSVTSIGYSAFSWCDSLTSVTIPDSVTSIGNGAFYNCTNLTTVYYRGTSSDWDKIAIDNSDDQNNYLLTATRYYYSETAPTTEGNFWHYVDGVPTVW